MALSDYWAPGELEKMQRLSQSAALQRESDLNIENERLKKELKTLKKVNKLLEEKFTSANSVPVDRVTVKRADWLALFEDLKK